MTAPLPWVKLHTKIISSPKWRSLSIVDRGIFLHLVALAGANGTPGVIEGTDSDLANMIGVTARELRGAVDRLARVPHESIARTVTGLIIPKWAEYQPAQANLSHAQRGRPTTLPVARVDKKREDQTREVVTVLEALEALPGWKPDLSRDIELVEELAAKFPTIDLASSIRGLGNWLEDGGQTGNVRNSVRNRVAKSFEFGRDLKTLTALPSYGPKRGIG
jgi:hypothetical protein